MRFIVVGMTAAILQGAPGTTLDVDLWLEVPPRGYMRILNLCRRLGAEVVRNRVVVFDHSVTVNFLYEVHGLRSFRHEYQRAKRITWLGHPVSVLPLRRIIRSKTVVAREKDLAHLPLLKRTLSLQSKLRNQKPLRQRP